MDSGMTRTVAVVLHLQVRFLSNDVSPCLRQTANEAESSAEMPVFRLWFDNEVKNDGLDTDLLHSVFPWGKYFGL